MRSLTVILADGQRQQLECATVEATNETLRLFGEPKRMGEINGVPVVVDTENGEPTGEFLGQFRLKGESCLQGWYWSEASS